MILTRILIGICLLQTLSAKTQNKYPEIIVEHPDKAAQFGTSPRDELFFIMNKLGPLIQKLDCRTEDSLLISTMTANLIINRNGKVDSVSFKNLTISTACKKALRGEFLKMKGWIPGQVKGVNVRSEFPFHISCIKWEEQ